MKTLLWAALSAAIAVSAQDFVWSGSVAQGKAIEIKGLNGSIHAELSSSGSIEVTAKKTARNSNPGDVRIDVYPNENGVTICAVYPGGGNHCGAGGDGRNNVKDNDVQVEFLVKVPAGVKFIGRNVNGDVEARNLQSDVNVHTVNGGIEAMSTGLVEGHTVNGNVKVTMGTIPTRALEFHTVNGTIEVSLPRGSGAQMEARTVNGSINSDFPMQVRGEVSKKKVDATLGNGGPALKLHTVNGSIRVKQA